VKICGAKAAVALGIVLAASQIAMAQLAPAPPVKRARAETAPPPVVVPQEFAPAQEAYAAFPEGTAVAAAPAPPSACQLRLAKIATFQPLPVLIGPGECGALDAVQLDTVILPDQTKVTITPVATLRCPMAEELARWVRDDVAPTAIKLGAPLRGLDNFDSYECRGRNRVRGATLSEHGRADAIDVRLFKLADGQALTLTDVNVDKAWREALRTSACARFSTVLGPGSDGAHEEHIHLDLAERRNNYKLCEWDIRVPPPPPVAQDKSQPADNAKTQAGEDEALIPLDMVPLPRPRPKLAEDASSRARKSDRN
jgi:hypothetical protein